MAGFKSDYLCDALLDHEMGATVWTAPATIYIAAFTAAPTSSGGGTEVTGGSYARVALTNNGTNFPAAASKTKRTGVAITFPSPSADWGSIVGLASFDAASGGNMLRYGPLSTPVTVTSGGAALSIPSQGGIFTEA